MASRWFASLPNLITIGRLVLTPAIIGLVIDEKWGAAFAVFVVAGISDALDGWLAKTYHLQSDLGAVLDPLADKTLIISIYVSLAAGGNLPVWLAILIVSRDALILGGVLVAWFLARPLKIRPHFSSKITTAVQIVLAAVILAGQAFGLRIEALEGALVASVAALTIASASVYLWLWVQHMRP
ncbi:CDP-alcohol phosphatidyltransferase family protein [Methylocystis sp. MJC1]|jgi:cardiolipin synthase|uniref:CDP-alcohol phosphatidyltransferase family protein n=1 Tax=Methylocystis sp. MJC1 TaxID=2654282 RepID=UPI0013E9DF44|nr:CDP-alcohol phosphatidyltransferase family protein [Methylocystis sp. MJC1]KAF2989387.1 putative CDP-diacylglycerol--glycerol-3-phosphate 3-phosphatidyl-transferase 2 [Methylocystis sp. MJC1]MBU6526864.1 CDP-alcohol phosphatidyltransferase family protein [Methylocystis sp. MJC1]UZX13302.1 CDP-alcohol phosphatidyltransferase family protein [Methylocystis sp. MJC1]